MEYDKNNVIDYFREYNEQIKGVIGVSGECEVEISNGLFGIVESISKKIVQGPYRVKGGSLGNTYTYRVRNEFCKQVFLYYLDVGEVPEFSVKNIVNSANENLPFWIGRSFEKYALLIQKLRQDYIV